MSDPSYPPQFPEPAPSPFGPPAAQSHAAPIGFTLGDISVYGDTINYPGGSMPLRGTIVTITDRTSQQESISTLGIILAVVFIWACLLSLLFLLMKEVKVTGWYEVGIRNGDAAWVTHVPVNSPEGRQLAWQQAEYLRSLAANS